MKKITSIILLLLLCQQARSNYLELKKSCINNNSAINRVDTLKINLKDLGVIGDGTTDNYNIISKALNQGSSPVKIFFPAGSYLISKPLATSHEGTIFLFDDNAKLIIPSENTGGIILKNNYCKVINANLQGNGRSSKAVNKGFGILLLGVSHCAVLNCKFNQISGMNIFLSYDGIMGCSNCLVKGNIIIKPAFNRTLIMDSSAIMLGYSGNGYFHTNNVIDNNIIDGNEVLALGIAIIGHGMGNTFSNNSIKNCLRYGIISYNSIYLPLTLKETHIINNKIENIGNANSSEPWGMGIYLMQSHFSTVIGNIVKNTLINTDNSNLLPPGGISLNGSTDCIIQNNYILNSNKYGIALNLSFNTKILHNTVDGAQESGIYLMNTNNNLVTENIIKNIEKFAIRGIFSNTSKPGLDWFNIVKYKDIATGQSISITNNKFYCSSENSISLAGESKNSSRRIVNNKIKNVLINNNTFYFKKRGMNNIKFDEEVKGSNKISRNKVEFSDY